MGDFYSHCSYRDLLKSCLHARKLIDPSSSAQRLAEAARVQKSYFSKVLSGKADLNSDQLFLISQFLKWTDDELDFAQLLLERDRSSVSDRRKSLEARIQSVRRKHLKIAEHVSAQKADFTETRLSEYYLDPWVQIVHVCLSIPRYAQDVRLLAHDLMVPEELIGRSIQTLVQLRMLKMHRNTLELTVEQLHLPKGSKLFDAWKSQLKLIVNERARAIQSPLD